jgi:hypothetical protein
MEEIEQIARAAYRAAQTGSDVKHAAYDNGGSSFTMSWDNMERWEKAWFLLFAEAVLTKAREEKPTWMERCKDFLKRKGELR